MTKNRYLIIGAQRPENSDENPGGIMVATSGLLEYAKQHSINADLLNVYSPSFPQPKTTTKIHRFYKRIIELRSLAKNKGYRSALIFTSGGLGFVERVCLAAVLEFYGTPTILYQVSGHFMDQVNSSKIFTFLAKLLLRIPTYVGAQGSQWISFYKKISIPEGKIKLIANWLSKDIKYPEKLATKLTSPKEVKFIYVGWLVQKKGIYDLLDAIEKSSLLKECDFEFIGGGVEEESVSDYIQQKGLTKISLTGWLDHGQVIQKMRLAHVLVFPSHTEGFPNALIEAMSQGLAIVASDVGAISDAIEEGKNGYLTKPQSPSELQNKLEAMVANYGDIPVMGQHSISIVKRDYSYNKNCQKLFAMLENA